MKRIILWIQGLFSKKIKEVDKNADYVTEYEACTARIQEYMQLSLLKNMKLMYQPDAAFDESEFDNTFLAVLAAQKRMFNDLYAPAILSYSEHLKRRLFILWAITLNVKNTPFPGLVNCEKGDTAFLTTGIDIKAIIEYLDGLYAKNAEKADKRVAMKIKYSV